MYLNYITKHLDKYSCTPFFFKLAADQVLGFNNLLDHRLKPGSLIVGINNPGAPLLG